MSKKDIKITRTDTFIRIFIGKRKLIYSYINDNTWMWKASDAQIIKDLNLKST